MGRDVTWGEAWDLVSRDTTRLRLVRAGGGEPVVLVHGTAGSKGDWSAVTRLLSERLAVTAYDRRGRGDSGDGPEYSIDREIEDLLAVIDDCGAPVHLIGHSFGAIVCLLATADAGEQVRDVILYEPPLGLRDVHERWLAESEAQIEAGDLDEAVKRFAAVANITADELAAIARIEPAWASLRDGVRQAPREIRAARSVLPIDTRILDSITAPTLVLIGEETEHAAYAGVRELAADLRFGRLEQVPGRHLALGFAPDALATVATRFITTSTN
jgi:pimeloyl-ACP methyl ester carboxylesterase